MRSRTDAFMGFVKEGKIIEFGCGAGSLLGLTAFTIAGEGIPTDTITSTRYTRPGPIASWYVRTNGSCRHFMR